MGALEGDPHMPFGLIFWTLLYSKGKNKTKIVRIPLLIQGGMPIRIDHIRLAKQVLLKGRDAPQGRPQ